MNTLRKALEWCAGTLRDTSAVTDPAVCDGLEQIDRLLGRSEEEPEDNVDITQHPMDLALQEKVYEAIVLVNSARQATYFASLHGGARDGNRDLVNALLNAGWRPKDYDPAQTPEAPGDVKDHRRVMATALGDIATRAQKALSDTC